MVGFLAEQAQGHVGDSFHCVPVWNAAREQDDVARAVAVAREHVDGSPVASNGDGAEKRVDMGIFPNAGLCHARSHDGTTRSGEVLSRVR